MMNLGVSMLEARRFEEAADYSRRAGEALLAASGPDGVAYVGTLMNLGEALQALGRRDEARPLYEKALSTWERTLGKDAPYVVLVLDDLGSLALEEERYEDARAHYARGLEIRRRTLPPQHLDLGRSLTGVGRALVGMGRAHEALSLLEESLAVQLAAKAPAAELAETRFALACALRATNRDAARSQALAVEASEAFAVTRRPEREAAVKGWLAATTP